MRPIGEHRVCIHRYIVEDGVCIGRMVNIASHILPIDPEIEVDERSDSILYDVRHDAIDVNGRS
jgi:hypothetical protein